MPASKKDKNRTRAGLSSATAGICVSAAPSEARYQPHTGPARFPGDPGVARKRTPQPDPCASAEMDTDLILTYLACHRLLEQALVRAGFVMALSSNKQPRPDWYRWTRHIEKQFDPASDEVLQMSVDYLLDLRDDKETLPGRLQNRIQWESASPFSDTLWLTEILQQTELRLTHRYNVAAAPGCDTPQVMAALFVVQAWLPLVPGG